MQRILILEPYFGGSHKQFLDGLQNTVNADYTRFTLPARKWKMRMQLSAPWFVAKIAELPLNQRNFTSVLCSTFVDVAMLRALLSGLEGWNSNSSFLTYFHENQFVYPRQDGKANYQFTAINFNTALASDKIAFNSHFNRESFFDSCSRYVKTATDMKLSWTVDAMKEKSEVIYPGIDFTEIDNSVKQPSSTVPVIVWNHRWEHDKNPQEFFDALAALQDMNVDFKLILLGQSFRFRPKCFDIAQMQFKKKIVHSGFAESYSEYASLLKQGDIVVSTSLHEFFGIAVIEALRAGCLPLLPARLSYPELFENNFLYGDGELLNSLHQAIINRQRLRFSDAKKFTDKFSWNTLANQYEQWLLS